MKVWANGFVPDDSADVGDLWLGPDGGVKVCLFKNPGAPAYFASLGGGAPAPSSNVAVKFYSGADLTTTDAVNFTDIPALAFDVDANTDYHIRWTLIFRSAATTTGMVYTTSGPASPTQVIQSIINDSAAGSFAPVEGTKGGFGGIETFGGSATANSDRVSYIDLLVKNGPNAGTITPRFRSEVAASQVMVRQGSSGIMFKA